MVYGGLVFSAMETDYFPRLSAVPADDVLTRNDVVNKQVEVSLILISPMLTVFITFLPIILPMLFSSKFNAVLPMVQITVLALYMRAMKLPLSYIALAKGDSKSFLFLEGTYAVVVFALVSFMFVMFGLTGTGYALLLTSVLDFIMLTVYTYYKYKYVMSRGVAIQAALMLPLGITACVASQTLHGAGYWVAGIFVSVVSLSVSFFFLHKKTHLMSALKKKIQAKFF